MINIFFSTIGTLIQAWLQSKEYIPHWVFLLDYRKYGFLAGIMLGFGMTLGELPNSFMKRQLDIPPGMKKKGLAGLAFFFLDQVDLAVGIWLLMFIFIKPSIFLVLFSFLITMVLHVSISVVGYLVGMRETIV